MTKIRLKTATFLLAATLLAGCGAATTAGLLRGPDEGSTVATQTYRSSQGGNWRGVPGAHELGIPRAMFRKAAARLKLTDDQKRQLREIHKTHARDFKKSDFKKYHEQLKALLVADKVDEGALRAFIDARVGEFSGRAAAHADTAAELRGVLTAEQRKELVAILAEDRQTSEIKQERQKLAGRAKKGMDAFKAKLGLNADQSAKFDALKAKLDGARKTERAALKKAVAAFVESGDKGALETALRDSVVRNVPAEELVQVASSLDKDQRERIVKRMDRFGKRGHGRRPKK